MKKHLTKFHIIGYLFILAMLSFLILSVSYARYTSNVSGETLASVALWGSEISSTESLDIKGLIPGAKKTYEFKITNQRNNKVSEVSQSYTIELETTNNLPLIFSISGKSDQRTDSGVIKNENNINFTNGTAILKGGYLLANKAENHIYTLSISWPVGDKDASYSDEIDALTLIVKAHQLK